MHGTDQAPIARASSEPSLEVVQNCAHSTRDTLTDIEMVITSIEDFLNGPRPEKEMGGNVEGCAAGILAQLCAVGANNHDRLMTLHRRISAVANSLGVQR